MGVTRKELFTDRQNELARIGKVLGHPARIAILQYLAETKACINSDLVDELGLAQATISQHLRELKEAGLVQGTIEGVSVNYCIHPKRWNEVKSLLNDLFDEYPVETPEDCC